MNPLPMDSNRQVYLRFLELADLDADMPAIALLKPNEAFLLQEVALRHFADQALKVSEVLNMKHLGSAATLHKRLQRLRSAGLLSVREEATDHRIKYLIATPLAMRHFERMGQAMKTAMLS